jgi:hypothetical protein
MFEKEKGPGPLKALRVLDPFLFAVAVALAVTASVALAAEPPKSDGQAPAAEGPKSPSAANVWQQAEQLYRDGKWQDAIAKYAELPQDWPGRDRASFRTACAYARLGKKAEALAGLKQAVDQGFVFFALVEQEPALDLVRNEDGFKSLMDKRGDCLKANADRRVGIYRKQLGEAFHVEKDDPYRLIVCSDLPDDVRGKVLLMLHGIADALKQDFFPEKPQIYIGLLIPANPAEFAKMIGRPGIAGAYNPQNRTMIINLATGPGTMAHEYAQALHFADMERRGQQHPIWIIEGFGTLCEQSAVRNGRIVGMVNWRLPILKQAAGRKAIIPLADLMADSNKYFADQRQIPLAYAEVRYVMLFLQEKGILVKWYNQYCEDWKSDPTGVKALEKTYSKPLAEFQADWLTFVDGLDFKMPKPPSPPKAEP